MKLLRLFKHKERPTGYYIVYRLGIKTFLTVGVKNDKLEELRIDQFNNLRFDYWEPMDNFERINNLSD